MAKRRRTAGACQLEGEPDRKTESGTGISADVRLPGTLAELPADPSNPREIDSAAAAGLKHSLKEFGDLSGIVFNLATNTLVAGHQRVQQLVSEYGTLPIEPIDSSHGQIVAPDGQTFAVRFVAWDLAKQKSAAVAANSPTIQGRFIDDRLELFLDDIRTSRSADFEAMMLGDLFGVDTDGGDAGKLKDQDVKKPPTMAWVLAGIPVADYGEISEAIERLSENPKVVMSITANNG